jgi:hypothetical protein
MHLLPLILIGIALLLGFGIDFVSKKRNSKSTPENLDQTAIQKDWYKPHMPSL